MKFSPSPSLLAAICYADVFDYPLTMEEATLWSIRVHGIEGKREGSRVTLTNVQDGSRTFIVLPHRNSIVGLRKDHERWSRKKWQIAKRVAQYLYTIPSIQLVGVTGRLAMNNTIQDDDIDFFIITAKKTLWTTRFLATLLVEILGVRRRPHDAEVNNKVCLNMFMSEDVVALPKDQQDLFAAHEVLQMQPLWQHDNTYKRFLLANRWVRKFLPNAYKNQKKVLRITYCGQGENGICSLMLSTSTIILSYFEPLARVIQLLYMKRRRTTEVISDGIIRFHPRDARLWVKRRLALLFVRYNIPLDKIFYAR